MDINPTLKGTDRVVNAVTGTALIAYALSGGLDKPWLQGAVVVLGLVFVIGGLGGT